MRKQQISRVRQMSLEPESAKQDEPHISAGDRKKRPVKKMRQYITPKQYSAAQFMHELIGIVHMRRRHPN